MVDLTAIFQQLRSPKVLVVGDLMLDTYTIGQVKRISPEAPVPVVNVIEQQQRAGGAGNVAFNLLSLGCEVMAVGRVGEDQAGKILKKILASEGVDVRGVFHQPGLPTPVKNRIIAEQQQIVRVDHEQILPVAEEVEKQVIDQLPQLLEGIQAVAISDYGKGFLSDQLLRTIIDRACSCGIPVLADPKGQSFVKYRGVTVLKPNLSEAVAAAGVGEQAPLDEVARKILEQALVDYLLITRSKKGCSLFSSTNERIDFPVAMKEIKDSTGAGDTVLATLTYALANNLPLNQAVPLANVAAGITIEHLGCARVTIADLKKCFTN